MSPDAPDETTPESVLAFWFEDAAHDPVVCAERVELWFGGDPGFDDAIRRRFGHLLPRAGALDEWQQDPRSTVALVLVLDQFPRNLHRGSAQAFAYDAQALAVARGWLARAEDREIPPLLSAFALLPFEHAEDLDCQRLCVAGYERLATAAGAEWRPRFEQFADFAQRHLDIVERFGRFPHRNEVLGRESTAAERAWLASGGERFGA